MQKLLEHYQKLFHLGFLFLLFMPALETWVKWFPEQCVAGYEQLYAFPQSSLSAWFSGDFQKQFDNWYQQHIGFRNAVIKTSNQIDFTIFNETNSGSQYILGKHRYLFEAIYLNSFNNLDTVSQSALVKSVFELKQLQDRLAKYKITLLVAITPSKATVYPELIPRKYILSNRLNQTSNYEKILPLLNQYHINYIDGHVLMLSLKRTAYPPFTAGGTHWDYYAACEFAHLMLNKIETLRKQPITMLSCKPVSVDNRPSGTDHDLTDLINIWTPQVIDGTVPHPTINTLTGHFITKPKILLIGSSFFITLQGIFKNHGIFSKRTFFHYYDAIMDNESNREQPLDKSKIDWQKVILSYNVIVIEANEARLEPLYSLDKKNEMGYGFIEDALYHL